MGDEQPGPFQLRDDDLVLELVEIAPHPEHKVPTYFFRMVRADSAEPLGRTNLRGGFNAHVERYAGHIGYAVDPAHRGHRYATRALAC